MEDSSVNVFSQLRRMKKLPFRTGRYFVGVGVLDDSRAGSVTGSTSDWRVPVLVTGCVDTKSGGDRWTSTLISGGSRVFCECRVIVGYVRYSS